MTHSVLNISNINAYRAQRREDQLVHFFAEDEIQSTKKQLLAKHFTYLRTTHTISEAFVYFYHRGVSSDKIELRVFRDRIKVINLSNGDTQFIAKTSLDSDALRTCQLIVNLGNQLLGYSASEEAPLLLDDNDETDAPPIREDFPSFRAPKSTEAPFSPLARNASPSLAGRVQDIREGSERHAVATLFNPSRLERAASIAPPISDEERLKELLLTRFTNLAAVVEETDSLENIVHKLHVILTSSQEKEAKAEEARDTLKARLADYEEAFPALEERYTEIREKRDQLLIGLKETLEDQISTLEKKVDATKREDTLLASILAPIEDKEEKAFSLNDRLEKLPSIEDLEEAAIPDIARKVQALYQELHHLELDAANLKNICTLKSQAIASIASEITSCQQLISDLEESLEPEISAFLHTKVGKLEEEKDTLIASLEEENSRLDNLLAQAERGLSQISAFINHDRLTVYFAASIETITSQAATLADMEEGFTTIQRLNHELAETQSKNEALIKTQAALLQNLDDQLSAAKDAIDKLVSEKKEMQASIANHKKEIQALKDQLETQISANAQLLGVIKEKVFEYETLQERTTAAEATIAETQELLQSTETRLVQYEAIIRKLSPKIGEGKVAENASFEADLKKAQEAKASEIHEADRLHEAIQSQNAILLTLKERLADAEQALAIQTSLRENLASTQIALKKEVAAKTAKLAELEGINTSLNSQISSLTHSLEQARSANEELGTLARVAKSLTPPVVNTAEFSTLPIFDKLVKIEELLGIRKELSFETFLKESAVRDHRFKLPLEPSEAQLSQLRLLEENAQASLAKLQELDTLVSTLLENCDKQAHTIPKGEDRKFALQSLYMKKAQYFEILFEGQRKKVLDLQNEKRIFDAHREILVARAARVNEELTAQELRVSQLEGKLTSTNPELFALTAQIQALKSEQQSLIQEKAQSDSALASLQKSFETFQQEARTLHTQIARLTSKEEEARAATAALLEEKARDTEIIKRAETTLAALRREIEELRTIPETARGVIEDASTREAQQPPQALAADVSAFIEKRLRKEESTVRKLQNVALRQSNEIDKLRGEVKRLKEIATPVGAFLADAEALERSLLEIQKQLLKKTLLQNEKAALTKFIEEKIWSGTDSPAFLPEAQKKLAQVEKDLMDISFTISALSTAIKPEAIAPMIAALDDDNFLRFSLRIKNIYFTLKESAHGELKVIRESIKGANEVENLSYQSQEIVVSSHLKKYLSLFELASSLYTQFEMFQMDPLNNLANSADFKEHYERMKMGIKLAVCYLSFATTDHDLKDVHFCLSRLLNEMSENQEALNAKIEALSVAIAGKESEVASERSKLALLKTSFFNITKLLEDKKEELAGFERITSAARSAIRASA